jgi:hypothetical protein
MASRSIRRPAPIAQPFSGDSNPCDREQFNGYDRRMNITVTANGLSLRDGLVPSSEQTIVSDSESNSIGTVALTDLQRSANVLS